MSQPQFAFSACCFWLTIFAFDGERICAASPAGRQRDELAVFDRFVGAWVFPPRSEHSFSAHLECKWILNKQFLQVDTKLIDATNTSTSGRTLIDYNQKKNCYRQWKFSDSGDVITAHGTWNEKATSLVLSGRKPNGNENESTIEFVDGNTIVFGEREFLDGEPPRVGVVRFVLSRVSPKATNQPKSVK